MCVCISAAESFVEDLRSSATDRRRQGRQGEQGLPVGAGSLGRWPSSFIQLFFIRRAVAFSLRLLQS